MPAGLAIAGIVGSIYSAHKSAGAAKDAARMQVQSTDRAQQFNERAYADSRQAMAPYQQAGNESLQRLMAQHWGTPLPQGTAPTGGSSAMLTGAARGFIPQQGPYAPPLQGGAPQSLAAMQAGGGPQQAQPQGGPTVKLQGPDGSTRDVPAQLADQFIARGARRVG